MTTESKPIQSMKLLGIYGGMILSVALGLVAYLSLRNALHMALVTFDVYMFAWRAIDIGVALVSMVGILILSIVDVYAFKKAADKGRLLKSLFFQCGILIAIALLFLLVWAILVSL